MSGESSGRVGVDLNVFLLSPALCCRALKMLRGLLLRHSLWKLRLPPVSPGCGKDSDLSDGFILPRGAR